MPWRRSHVRSSKPFSGPGRQLHDDERVEDGALRRGAAEVELELCRLVDRATVERSHVALRAEIELAFDRRRRDHDAHAAGMADLGGEWASVERVETGARPPPAGEPEQQRERADADDRRVDEDRDEAGERGEHERDPVEAPDVREREPGRQRPGQDVSGCGPESQAITSPRRLSIRAGPMPGIASRSSTDLNGPFWVR